MIKQAILHYLMLANLMFYGLAHSERGMIDNDKELSYLQNVGHGINRVLWHGYRVCPVTQIHVPRNMCTQKCNLIMT